MGYKKAQNRRKKSGNRRYSQVKQDQVELDEFAVSSGLANLDPTAHREVNCTYGVIDVVNCEYVIEVKQVRKWKQAIGQALVYALDYPDKIARVHLFGSVSRKQKGIIENACESLGVALTWDETVAIL